MCTCGIECQVTLKHQTCKTRTNLFNADYSSLLGHDAVVNGKALIIFWKSLLSMTTEMASFSEMMASIYQSKWIHIPEDMNHHQHHCENLKSHFETLTPRGGGGTFLALQ
jgi:hypothetical protein